MLNIRSISVAYGMRLILHDITFNVAKGEVVALIGPNGAGKTTLMRSISGVLRPKEGFIQIDGKDVAQLSATERASLLAVVPQARDLPDLFTVEQTVLIGRTPYLGWFGQPAPRDRQRVEWTLERTGLLALRNRRIGELSGGEQQRVLLARALAQETPILLLDEPTSQLDLQHQSILLNLVKELAREQNLAVLMAMHDLNLTALFADRVALLVQGQLRALGSPREVLCPSTLAAAYQVPVHVIVHPDYGTPLILPDGRYAEKPVLH